MEHSSRPRDRDAGFSSTGSDVNTIPEKAKVVELNSHVDKKTGLTMERMTIVGKGLMEKRVVECSTHGDIPTVTLHPRPRAGAVWTAGPSYDMDRSARHARAHIPEQLDWYNLKSSSSMIHAGDISSSGRRRYITDLTVDANLRDQLHLIMWLGLWFKSLWTQSCWLDQ